MAYFNFLSHCFKLKKAGKPGFIWNKLAGERVSWEYIDIVSWDYVIQDIKKMADVTMDVARLRELYEARGDRALKQLGCDQLIPYIEGFQFEHTLLIWHIATEICFNLRAKECYISNQERKQKRIFSKKLSDYMMYLLIRRPKLMSAVAGISHIRYGDTCAEVKLLARKKLEDPTMQGFCELILRERANIIEPETKENNHPFSVLNDSCKLVDLLSENDNMWEVLYMVWLELLLYAASHCIADSHARLLSEGSEFITVIWALMSFCGIGDHFPVNSSSVLRMQRREEDAEQVSVVDDNNVAEDPNPGQAAVGALRVPQRVEDANQVAAVGDDPHSGSCSGKSKL